MAQVSISSILPKSEVIDALATSVAVSIRP
jgi:hypothetical protein